MNEPTEATERKNSPASPPRPIELRAPPRPTAALWFHTVRQLRYAQLQSLVIQRLRRTIERPERFSGRAVTAAPPLSWAPRYEFLPPGPQDNTEGSLLQGSIRFLNETAPPAWPPAWSPRQLSRLWEYNLHYFEYLWALGFESARFVARDWIARHRLDRGAVGWEPYPTSNRLMNWCGVFFARYADEVESDPEFREELWSSIYLQSEWLLRRIETHLMGNHLLENAVALAFCGTCFAGEDAQRWKQAGIELLTAELPEQILQDGCHFEQSPMYQLRVFYALTALLNTGDAELRQLVNEPLERMQGALRRLRHPDGGIPLLGDSALSMYNEPGELLDWWSRVCGRSAPPTPAGREIFSLPRVGYYGARRGDDHYLICDAGPTGPRQQPGHAHGDVFSFELSLGGRRVICDSGVHGYDEDPLRGHCRSTRAHNTVEIDSEDQAEFWATFRVARRATPHDVQWEATDDGFRLSGWHDGYQRLRGSPKHYRQFTWHERGALLVEDRISCARPVRADSRLHLHPDCRVADCDERTVRIDASWGEFYVAFAGHGRLGLESSVYCPEFGVRLENLALVFSSTGTNVEMGFCISGESLDDARSLSDALFLS
jgi:uncharacterized heparinase superfamily protein